MSRTRRKSPAQLCVEQDENGHYVFFQVPKAAMFYGYACVRLSQQDKIDDGVSAIAEAQFMVTEN